MHWTEAVDIVVARTKHERYRWLCSDDNPDADQRARYRDQIIVQAIGHPPLDVQARDLARSLWDWAVSGFSMTGDEEMARRLAICATCPQWDDGRCKLCGCYLAAKVRLKTEHCPISKW